MIGIIFALLMLAALGWWWTGPSSDELVVYPATCANDRPILPLSLVMRRSQSFEKDLEKYDADRANCVILPLNPRVYKINEKRGEVYYKLLDQAERLVDCAIFSRTEWTCSHPDGSAKVVIIDGLRAIHADEVSGPGGVHFSLRRWQWWGVTLSSWWTDRPRGAWLIPEQHEYY